MQNKRRYLHLFVILVFVLGLIPTQAAQSAYPCPCSIWGPVDVPATQTQEALPVELGVQFQSEVAGYIKGVRFYKASGNTGTHYGHLWTDSGDLLGQVVFTGESASGWQEAYFPTPIAVLANTTYIASYHTSTGHWSYTAGGLGTAVHNEPLRALANGADSPGNGVYKYGESGSFPTESYNSTNYWVDVVFDLTTAPDTISPTVSSVTPISSAVGVDRDANITALFSEAMDVSTITPGNFELRDSSTNLVPATVTYAAGYYTAQLDPVSSLAYSTTYTATIKSGVTGVADLSGNQLAADYTWSFTTEEPDTTPPTVAVVTPVNGALSIDRNTNITAQFNEPMDPSSITSTNFELRGPSSALVPAAVTFSAGSNTAVVNPASALAFSTIYTATVKGGATGVADVFGNRMSADYSWSFTTEALPPPPPDDGPGGPILIISDAGNPFGRYYAEILRTEGLNEFLVTDISNVNVTSLSTYDVVILGELSRSLTSTEVTMLTNWVEAGGNLIAMRPDKQLAGLLGLTDANAVLPTTQLFAYLLIDTSKEPGSGLVGETIQYHGVADLYTLNGATTVATLYSDATTATTNPAVTIRNIGPNGGQAAAFTYDLARSIVYTRQGNPDWAGTNRDTLGPAEPRIISDDLFYGNAPGDPQPDYVDFNKLTIPQADEQQRLLANMIQMMNRDNMPLPRFWYFPRGEKAVVVMTGDDHGGGGGTIGRFDHYKAISTPGCSVEDWECIRGSSYLFNTGNITDAQAAAYNADGFEIGLHVNTGCVNWTPPALENFYQSQLTAWYASYPSLPHQVSERTHCVNWTDWVTQAKVQTLHGIRMDTNYYYYPSAFVQERPGMFTGSGMPMRFADLDGTMIDVYQGVTHMTDESSYSYGIFNPTQINTLLSNAVGSNGFYGAFLANMHTDGNPHQGSEDIINAAVSRGVPVVSGRQMVTWLDGRNTSSFNELQWNGSNLSFAIDVGTGANGLQAMLPTNSRGGFLTNITRDTVSVPFTTETIKGIEYALFPAGEGSYSVTYLPDTTGPVISNVVALASTGGTAQISWTTNEASNSSVNYGTSPTALSSSLSDEAMVSSHQLTLSGLAVSTTYYYRVTSVDLSGNSTTYPPIGDDPLHFVMPTNIFLDTTLTDFGGGTTGTETYITQDENGEVILRPAVGSEFFGASLPPDWSIWQYPATGSGGTAQVSAGIMTVNGARVGTNATYGPGQSLEFVATFTAEPYQHVGFGVDFFATGWAIFSTDSTNGTTLQARSNLGGTSLGTDTTISGSWLGAPHKYRIEWKTSEILYYIDDQLVVTHPLTININMRPMAAEHMTGEQTLKVDWMRMSPYAATGIFTSRIFDSVGVTEWDTPTWTADVPAGTSLTLDLRTGDTPIPDDTWTDFTPLTYGTPIGRTSRYLQYRAVLGATSNAMQSPVLREVRIGYISEPDDLAPTVVSRSPAPGATGVSLSTNLNITFSEAMDPTTINGSTIRLRAVGSTEDVPAVVTYSGLTATLDPTPILNIGATYEVTLTGSVADISGNPLGSTLTWQFTVVTGGSFTDNTYADFSGGTTGSNTYVAQTADGEVILSPTAGAEFSGGSLPLGWYSAQYHEAGGPAGAYSISDGKLFLDGVMVGTTETFTPGRWVEFVGTFSDGPYQHIGFGTDYTGSSPLAIFSTDLTGSLFQARSSPSNTTALTTEWNGVPHRYRIEWNTNTINFYIDDVLVDSDIATVAGPMRPLAAEYGFGSHTMSVDWLRMGPYTANTGVFVSRTFDANQSVQWTDLSYTADLPAGTSVAIETQTSMDGVVWSAWQAVSAPLTNPNGRYLRYRATITTDDLNQTAVLENVNITYSTAAPTAVVISSFSGEAHHNTIQLDWETAQEIDLIGFNVYRSASLAGLKEKQNAVLIPAKVPGQMYGATYQFTQPVEAGQRYFFWLEQVDSQGTDTTGPVAVLTDHLIFIPLLRQ